MFLFVKKFCFPRPPVYPPWDFTLDTDQGYGSVDLPKSVQGLVNTGVPSDSIVFLIWSFVIVHNILCGLTELNF